VQEDAYDAVKTHMFELLAAVAAVCQPSQLDMLFAKLERRQARSVQDAVRLLTLLATLADGDHEVGRHDLVTDQRQSCIAQQLAANKHTQHLLLGQLLPWLGARPAYVQGWPLGVCMCLECRC
jgi:hypothetical protein